MFGKREIVGVVGGLQEEVVTMKSEVITIVETMKEYFDSKFEEANNDTAQRFKVLESRLNRKIEEEVAPKVIYEITRSEKEKEMEEKKRKIKLCLSEVYANSEKYKLLSDCGRKLTKEGDVTYRLMSNAVLEVAKFHGSKSINKIASRSIYNKFTNKYGTEPLNKKILAFSDGSGIESVFADIFKKGLVGKYVEFIEDEFVN